jgi:protein involved in polysaccharide export with SLBB domain
VRIVFQIVNAGKRLGVGSMRLPRFVRAIAFFATLAQAGCFSTSKKPASFPLPPETPIASADLYTLACPDVIEVIFRDRPEEAQSVKIATDGCITIGNLQNLRLEGLTVAEAARAIAERSGVSPARIRVQVVEYNSREILLYGEVSGEPRVIDYRGPETVVELLDRAGGLSADADSHEIHVVRAHLSEGMRAEVLRVDLDAIRKHNDMRTNIRVQPLDAIYAGEADRSRIRKSLPELIKPLYEGFLDLVSPQPESASISEKP